MNSQATLLRMACLALCISMPLASCDRARKGEGEAHDSGANSKEKPPLLPRGACNGATKFDGDSPDSGAKSEGKPSLVLLRREGDGHAVFRLDNATSKSIWFYGYGLSSPLFFVERQTPEGWVNETGFWCGTGVRAHQLPAGQSTMFTAPLSRYRQPMRVSIRYYEHSKADDSCARVVRSEKVDLSP
jgi:hypothetical protein